jgi:hypothetical protein
MAEVNHPDSRILWWVLAVLLGIIATGIAAAIGFSRIRRVARNSRTSRNACT